MTKLKVGSITLIVNGYYINNGRPYFQRAVPADLRKRLGKSKIQLHSNQSMDTLPFNASG